MTRLTRESGEQAIRRWFDAALRAVDPANAVLTHLRRSDRLIVVGGVQIQVAGSVFVAAIGKAAAEMARGAVLACGDLIDSGLIITKDGHLPPSIPAGFEAYESGHPIPDRRGVAATNRLFESLAGLGRDDLVLALISGGGSALLESPVEGVSLEDVAVTTGLLLRAGAPIQALNAVRVPLSRVKGGGLRRAAPRSRFVTLLLSDVLGNDPRVIASGPTVPTDFTATGAIDVLERFGVTDRVPASVLDALRTSTSGSGSAAFETDLVCVVCDNAAAVHAFGTVAGAEGATAEFGPTAVQGEARERAVEFVAHALGGDAGLLLGGGETTVTVRGNGNGGRNTEFALAAALELERRGRRDWLIASLATDGQDALTGVAGAVASVSTLERARAAGVDPETALDANDSLAVFRAGGGCVEPGPTGTNVNDLYVALRIEG